MKSIHSLLLPRLNFLKKFTPEIRNRLFAIAGLVSCIFFLIYFDVQQGFTSWNTINSKLSIFVAINVNIVLLVLVFYLILKNLLKLIFEGNRQALGVNLKTKLIIAFILISLPATLSHLFSTLYTNSALESWLANQRETAKQNAQSISTAYYRNLHNLLEVQGWLVKNALINNPEILNSPQDLNYLITQGNAEGVTIYSNQQAILFQALRTYKSEKYWRVVKDFEWEQIRDQPKAWLSEDLGKRRIWRLLQKVTVEKKPMVIEILYVDTKHLTSALNDMDDQEINTKILAESEELIKNYYIISLLLMVFLIVFVATWFAFYLARGFVHPIEQLADATQRVAHGELGFQVVAEKGMPLDRDFGQLVNSFNSMSQELFENQIALQKTTEHLQKSHLALEEHTRFVELVLENIKTGVISLDMEGQINGLNRAAKKFLQLKQSRFLDEHYRKVLDKESLELFEEMFQEIRSKKSKSISRELSLTKNEEPLDISVTLLTLENREKEPVGMISVYENVTEIQRFQRAHAWRDVARRIAHEIKNPLTPIQLSAERIRRKYLNQMPDSEVLDQATQTIVKEVEMLKNMVNEFSNFARLPESNLQPDNFNLTIEEAVQLYRNAISERIRLITELDDQVPRFSLDREQMKRVFINLIDNAVAAIDGEGEIKISTAFDAELKMVRIEVADTGPGVPPEIRHRLFEPYTTTQKHGTGLGLSIVAQIISDHNGYIRQQNLESGGSCFSIELPVT
ncbi:MAG: PAS domain-containing protein [SAR324 cluster bacterium]|nr:PAS domain-containing protein [SAR324 cluster bacterium]